MKRPIVLTLALMFAAATEPALAQEPRVRGLVIFGNDPCPKGSGDEIIVCARRPEAERYRIPPEIQRELEVAAVRNWNRRARETDALGRSGIGSCTTVGPGGAAGCTLQSIEKGMAEQR